MESGNNRSTRLIAFCAIAWLFGSADSQAITYSFADALQPGGVLLANGATMSGQLFSIGVGSPSAFHGQNSGTDPADVGGVYNGTVFDPSADTNPDPTLVTRLSAEPRESVDQGFANDHRDAVGIYISFSLPTLLQDFYVLDIDGRTRDGGGGNTEWAASFGFNGDDLVLPTLTVAALSDLVVLNQSTHANWQSLVDGTQGISGSRDAVPGQFPFAVNFSDNETHVDPDDPYTQALFDYNVEVTDFYVLWGVQRDINGTGQQNSGLTGFSSPVGTPTPDAGSTAAALGLAILSMAAFRRTLPA